MLLAEDDTALNHRLKTVLSGSGFAVDIAENGLDAAYMGDSEAYDAIVLDLKLPGRAGLEVLQHWRAHGNAVPVLILITRDAWHEGVDGWRAGADDYLGKPFDVEDLTARLHAVIRRRKEQVSGTLCVGGMRLDEDGQALIPPNGSTVLLTDMEYRLLRYFMLHPCQVLSTARLRAHAYDWDTDPDSDVIEVYVKRLRAKCGQDIIHTRRGQGYVFRAPN
jgi:DNA-binding response OmpR family regulator